MKLKKKTNLKKNKKQRKINKKKSWLKDNINEKTTLIFCLLGTNFKKLRQKIRRGSEEKKSIYCQTAVI